MRGARDLRLSDAEYVLSPSESMRSWSVVPYLKSAFSGGGEDYHLYDVHGPGGELVLTVAVTFDNDLSGDSFIETSSLEKTFEFRDPSGEAQMRVRRTGITTNYEVTDATSGELLATFGPGFPFVWRWKLRDETGDAAAVVRKPITGVLRNAVSISTHRTHIVRSPAGDELARFDRVRAEGGPTSWMLSEVEVAVRDSAVPVELLLALAFGLTHKGGSSSGGGD